MFSEKINKALKEQGIKKKWLAKQMGILPTNLTAKMKKGVFNDSEVFHISSLLNMNTIIKNDYCVYVLTNKGKAIYIGCTKDIKRRLTEHKENKEFDKHIVIKKTISKKEAYSIENTLINFVTLFGDSNWYNSENIVLSNIRDLYLRCKK